MIFKLTLDSDVQEYVTGKDHLHVLQSYDDEYDSFHDIVNMEEISIEESKKCMVRNLEYNENDPDEDMPEEISLYDLGHGDDFEVIASTEW